MVEMTRKNDFDLLFSCLASCYMREMKLLFLMQAPATQFVRTLNAVPAKFVRTLAAIRDSK